MDIDMLGFTEAEIAALTTLRAIEIGPSGAYRLVGLNHEETGFYLAYSRAMNRQHDHEATERYLVLHQKHEARHLAIVLTEDEARDSDLIKH